MYIIIFIVCLAMAYGAAVVFDKTSNEESKTGREWIKGKGF